MKRIATLVVVFSLFALTAVGQDALLQPKPNEVLIGPIALTEDVQGVPVVTRVTSFVAVATANNEVQVTLRTVADLADLQNKIGSIIDTAPLPTNNCDHFGVDNIVARIHTKQLTIDGGTATIRLSGDVDNWTCAKNPVPCSRVDFEDKNVFGAIIRVPKLTFFECNPPIKNRNVNQPFDAQLPFTLAVVDPQTAAVQLGSPSVNLGGVLGGVTQGILRIAGVDINARARDALSRAISPDMLRRSLPPEVLQLNPRITNATLFNNNGSLAAAINLSAAVPGSALSEFIQLLLKAKKP